MPRAVWLVAALLAGALAGCADPPSDAPPPSETQTPSPGPPPPGTPGEADNETPLVQRDHAQDWHVWGVQHPLEWQQVFILNNNCLGLEGHRGTGLVELHATLDRGNRPGVVANWRFGFAILGSDNDWWFEETGSLPLSNSVDLREHPIGDWEFADTILVYAIPDDPIVPVALDEILTLELTMIAERPDSLVPDGDYSCA